jgi:N utilization substance protein B
LNPSDLPDGAAAPAPAAAPAEAAARKPAPKSARRRAREFALQGLYEWQIGRADAGVIDAHMREQDDFAKCDSAHFDALLHGCIAEAEEIDGLLRPSLDRPVGQLSPVEHAALMIGVYELKHCIDVPYRVAINECVELAKSFGGTDGHKFVNGVLDRTAATLRPHEARNAPRRPR